MPQPQFEESTLSTLTKPTLASKTVWGGLVAVGAGIAGLFGYQLDPTVQTGLVELVTSAGAVIGGAIAIYGRIKATHAIK